jgi:MFS family permease
MCNATFYLGRQHYIIEVVPPSQRAVALSTLGGSHRIGLFFGPFVGAAAIHLSSMHVAYQSAMRAAYLVAVAAALAAALTLAAVRDLPAYDPARTAAPASPVASRRQPLRTIAIAHRQVLLTLGFGVLAVGAARSARQTVIPLWAAHIGLNATTTSLVFGVATAVDMALFYPAGRIMDQYGRVAIAVPSMLILGGATALLPLTHGTVSLALGAIAMSFGNGLGSGIIMTLGADVAPADARVGFLSIWRTMSDAGTAVGPLVVAALAAVWTLAAGIVAIGSIGLVAAFALWRWVPLHSAYANRRMILAARAPTPR